MSTPLASRPPREAAAASELLAGLEECDDDVRVSKAVKLAAEIKIDRAKDRRRNILAALRDLGHAPTLPSAGADDE